MVRNSLIGIFIMSPHRLLFPYKIHSQAPAHFFPLPIQTLLFAVLNYNFPNILYCFLPLTLLTLFLFIWGILSSLPHLPKCHSSYILLLNISFSRKSLRLCLPGRVWFPQICSRSTKCIPYSNPYHLYYSGWFTGW